MKIIVNINSIKPPLSGIGNYTFNIVRCLLDSPRVTDIKGFDINGVYNRESLQNIIRTACDIKPASSDGHYQKSSILRLVKNMAKKVPFAVTVYGALNRYRMTSFIGNSDYVYWEPNYYCFPYSGKSIVTIHDISHIRFPEYHPQERVNILNKVVEKSIKRATYVCVVSDFTRSEIINHLNVPKDKITIVYPGVSEQFKQYPEPEIDKIKKKYLLNKPYVLYVGMLEPRKNIANLIAAFKALPKEIKENYDLVLVGHKGWRTEKIDQMIEIGKNEGWLKQMGYVDQNHLPIIVSASILMAYPSYYEGFGMPIVEAMASGTPVLTSKVASMPEVSAGAAYLIDPYSVQNMTDGLLKLITDRELRETLILKGLDRAKDFTWEAAANKIIDLAKQ